MTHFMILNEILTLCKFVFAEKNWQHELLGNGKAGTPESGEKKKVYYSWKGKVEDTQHKD